MVAAFRARVAIAYATARSIAAFVFGIPVAGIRFLYETPGRAKRVRAEMISRSCAHHELVMLPPALPSPCSKCLCVGWLPTGSAGRTRLPKIGVAGPGTLQHSTSQPA